VFLSSRPAAASPGDGADKLGEIRDEVKRLEAQGAYERALVLLRGIVESSLDPVSRLERSQRIDEISSAQLAKYGEDRKRAADLEKAGKHAEAAAALDQVSFYASEKQVGEARLEQERLRAEGDKAAADAKARVEEESKKKAVDTVADAKSAKGRVVRWIEARKQLLCSKCRGAQTITCSACEGAGRRRAIAGTYRRGQPADVPCERCKEQGKVQCPDCGGLGFAAYKLADVLWGVWSAGFQKELDVAVGSKKKYIDLMVAKFNKKPAGSPAVDACYGVVGMAVEPIRGVEAFDVQVDAASGIATAKYRVRTRDDERWEETRWRKDDGQWSLVPPDLEKPRGAGGPASGKGE
jgi:hypothetical protein